MLGESKKEEFFSFLTNKSNNKKFRKPGYAENFEAKLTWLKGDSNWRGLNDSVDKNKPERVRYLPQNYFEKLTNELEIEAFRNEIEDVVFSHVDDTDRLGQASFEELEDYKTQQSKEDTSNLKTQLRKLNIEIVKLEEKSDPLTLSKLSNELSTKENELKALEKPKKVDKPSEEDEEQQKLTKEIEIYTTQLDSVEKTGLAKKKEISLKKDVFQKLDTLHQSLSQLDEHISTRKLDLKEASEELGFNIEDLIKAEINKAIVLKEQSKCKDKIGVLEKDTELDFEKLDFNNKSELKNLSYPDLRKAYSFIQNKINSLKEKLGAPQRKYQSYIEKLKKHKDEILKINGRKDNPQPNTIYYLKNTISYIKTDLAQELEGKYKERKTFTQKIFVSKSQILSFYSNLKNSVESRLDSVRSKDFSVDINASFVLDNSFEESFLKFVNQKRNGPFRGLAEGGTELRNLISLVDWNSIDSIYDFTDSLLNKMVSNKNGKVFSINEQVNDTKEFYDFLFSLEFMSPKYELRLGDKNLNELSPGEKGMLLLVFYLQLDKDNIPLIIDQPEDNLDNDSVFMVLANCIRQAKENRQVILVTHNPNLAVGADAEQIIYVKLNKADNYKFDYESGAIETPRINKKIVKVLEGSQPAFVKRRLIYQI